MSPAEQLPESTVLDSLGKQQAAALTHPRTHSRPRWDQCYFAPYRLKIETGAASACNRRWTASLKMSLILEISSLDHPQWTSDLTYPEMSQDPTRTT